MKIPLFINKKINAVLFFSVLYLLPIYDISAQELWEDQLKITAKDLISNYYAQLNNYCNLSYTIDERTAFKTEILKNLLHKESSLCNDLVTEGSSVYSASEYLDNLLVWFPLQSTLFTISNIKVGNYHPELSCLYVDVVFERTIDAKLNTGKLINNTKKNESIYIFSRQ